MGATPMTEQMQAAEQEQSQLKQYLALASGKKLASISSHLIWQEDCMISPDHIVPGIGRNSPTWEGNNKCTVTTSQDGVEVTFNSATQMQRVQQLKTYLQKAMQQHENDWQHWYLALDEAVTLKTMGKQLSIKQQ
jgi:hypothetical protein